jgi:hypothetical protein
MEYVLSRKTTLSHDTTTTQAWVIGIELNLEECPRLRPEGSVSINEFVRDGDDFEPGLTPELMAKAAAYHGSNRVLAADEKQADLQWLNIVKDSASAIASRRSSRSKPKEIQFTGLVNGNSPSAGGILTKWEAAVLDDMDAFFVLDESSAKIQKGVTVDTARRFAVHCLHVVRLRLVMRRAQKSAIDEIASICARVDKCLSAL